MKQLNVATVQFENASGNKEFNLSRIEYFCRQAASSGATVVAFHECSITGYTFARKLSKERLTEIAEPIPAGSSTQRLIRIAKELNIYILAGLFELGSDDKLYKAYICVGPDGFIANP